MCIRDRPYHNMFSSNQFYPVQRTDSEKEINHPVYKAFMENSISKTFSRDEVRETVLAGYMGLIKQIDDNLGRLFKFLEDTKRVGEKESRWVTLSPPS